MTGRAPMSQQQAVQECQRLHAEHEAWAQLASTLIAAASQPVATRRPLYRVAQPDGNWVFATGTMLAAQLGERPTSHAVAVALDRACHAAIFGRRVTDRMRDNSPMALAGCLNLSNGSPYRD